MSDRSLLTKIRSLIIFSTKVKLPASIIIVDTPILSLSFSMTEYYTSRIWKPYNDHDLNKHTCTRKAISTTRLVITPITSPKTPLATVEEPISTSIYKNDRKVLSWSMWRIY